MQRGNCRGNPSVNATVRQNFEVTKVRLPMIWPAFQLFIHGTLYDTECSSVSVISYGLDVSESK